jgi:hypothetical protein
MGLHRRKRKSQTSGAQEQLPPAAAANFLAVYVPWVAHYPPAMVVAVVGLVIAMGMERFCVLEPPIPREVLEDPGSDKNPGQKESEAIPRGSSNFYDPDPLAKAILKIWICSNLQSNRWKRSLSRASPKGRIGNMSRNGMAFVACSFVKVIEFFFSLRRDNPLPDTFQKSVARPKI